MLFGIDIHALMAFESLQHHNVPRPSTIVRKFREENKLAYALPNGLGITTESLEQMAAIVKDYEPHVAEYKMEKMIPLSSGNAQICLVSALDVLFAGAILDYKTKMYSVWARGEPVEIDPTPYIGSWQHTAYMMTADTNVFGYRILPFRRLPVSGYCYSLDGFVRNRYIYGLARTNFEMDSIVMYRNSEKERELISLLSTIYNHYPDMMSDFYIREAERSPVEEESPPLIGETTHFISFVLERDDIIGQSIVGG
jgi:hypothetical protein